jgi:hypothetical protein
MKYVVKRPTLAANLSRREKASKREARKLDAKLRGMGTSLDQITKQMAMAKQRVDEQGGCG